MFSAAKLINTEGHFLRPERPIKPTSALLHSKLNYSDSSSPVSSELKTTLWGVIHSQSALTELYVKVKNSIRLLSHYKARTSEGYCSVSPQVKNMTCRCCKFTSPDAVLEAKVFALISNYHHSARYDGIAVYRLVQESELGDIDFPPDVMLYQEFGNPNFLWRDLVARYFSRFHWMAVRHETLRLLTAWLEFMSTVNQPTQPLLFMNSQLTERVLQSLSPYIPPKPDSGDFLLSVDHAESLRQRVFERAKLFSESVCYVEYNPKTLGRYALCDVVDRFTIYGGEDATPSSGESNLLLQDLFIRRECHRRDVNSIRAMASTMPEFFSPIELSVMECLADPNGNSAHYWKCSPEELEMCHYALGTNSGSIWISYIAGETCVATVKHFWCSTKEQICQLLEALFITRQCYGNCEVEVTAFRSWDEFNSIGYFECEYAIGIVNVENSLVITNHVEQFIRQNCVAGSIKLEYPLQRSEYENGCVLLYRFEYTEQPQY